ncbi:MAG: hypothetical protein Q9164_004445 [Protoblastenia rupestris]
MTMELSNLPYELFSRILDEAAKLNVCENTHYTYGLSQAPEPGQDVRMQRVVRGNVPIDTQKWNATDAIRQVNRRFHDWATEHALRDLYITRWRGSERWVQSRTLSKLHGRPSSIAVYRDPYHSLRATLKLFTANPALASCVRRIWFDGYYGAETNAMIFAILRLCIDLKYVTLPWTALRYGTIDDWSHLLGRNKDLHSIESLELLAVDLKRSRIDKEINKTDNNALNSPEVNFQSLQRLKIQGHSNFFPITDGDLTTIARTANHLREIHITNTASLSITGINALASASRSTLAMIEHTPLPPPHRLQNHHPKHSSPTQPPPRPCICTQILACPNLRTLSLSLSSLCAALFTKMSVRWTGEVQIRTSTLCNYSPHALRTSAQARNDLWQTLDAARALMISRRAEGAQLDIEVLVHEWIFEPGKERVHGNFSLARVMSEGTWPMGREVKSGKGPYGQNGGFGKEGEGEWTSIPEDLFREHVERGIVSFY